MEKSGTIDIEEWNLRPTVCVDVKTHHAVLDSKAISCEAKATPFSTPSMSDVHPLSKRIKPLEGLNRPDVLYKSDLGRIAFSIPLVLSARM